MIETNGADLYSDDETVGDYPTNLPEEISFCVSSNIYINIVISGNYMWVSPGERRTILSSTEPN